MMTTSERKVRLRGQMRTRRRAMSERERAEASRRFRGTAAALLGDELLSDRRGATVLAYLATPTEPDVGAVMNDWHDAGARILVPVARAGRRLEWTPWTPGARVGRSSVAPVPEPVDIVPEVPASVDLALIPALAVGRDGVRLGQGGGYYDTFLASPAARGATTVGVVFEHEILEAGEVPAEPWDAVLDAAWSPAGLTRLPHGLRR